MTKFGVHSFLWHGQWTTELGNDAIRQSGEHGFDFIEITMLRPQIFEAESHKKALKEAGIEAIFSLTLPKDAHMPHEPERAKQFLSLAMDKMEIVGSTLLAGCIAYSLGTLTGKPPQPEELQVVVDTLGEVALDAKRRGIRLALEVCNRYETYMFNSLTDTRNLLKKIGSDNLFIHADSYHMNIEEEGYRKPLSDIADVLAYMHMSESHRGLVGSGTVNWDEVFGGLVDAKYTGPLVLESFAAINPDLAAATCLWRPTNRPPTVLASEGLAFLKAGAKKAGLQ